MEALAPKVGNVHRGADFSDASVADFVLSGAAMSSCFVELAAGKRSLGEGILSAVHAMKKSVQTNTYLGAILLLAPLAAVPRQQSLQQGLRTLLENLTPQDAKDVYEAILVAAPGGLGHSSTHDVRGQAPDCLLTAMKAGAERDLIARQYCHGFKDVFQAAVPLLQAAVQKSPRGIAQAIVRTQLELLAQMPDTLIARKCGDRTAHAASMRAARVLAQSDDEAYASELADFDFWLRADGNRRNPGATADLITAALFVLLREGWLTPPWRMWADEATRA